MSADPYAIPDVYVGPEATLRRFQAGWFVSRQDLLDDESAWVIEVIGEPAMRRLRSMVERV